MNWISNFVRPRLRSIWKARRGKSASLWAKCPKTGKLIFRRELEANLFVFPESGHHMPIGAERRFAMFFDGGESHPIETPDVPLDPLQFRDQRRYADRLKEARGKTGVKDAATAAWGSLDGISVVVVVQDFAFMGGSLGMAAGETFIRAADHAVEHEMPMILFSASGGARMQEGLLSLMQMPRTTVAVGRLREARCPYIVVLTHPTTGGVTASYAMLGDIHLAEPEALIAFSGPRVIEQTIRTVLPEGFQRSEYLRDRGMVDMIVPRGRQRETIARLIRLLRRMPPPKGDLVPVDGAAAEKRESVAPPPAEEGE